MTTKELTTRPVIANEFDSYVLEDADPAKVHLFTPTEMPNEGTPGERIHRDFSALGFRFAENTFLVPL